MIRANELRIGNWVEVYGRFGKVRSIDPEGDIFNGVVSNDDDTVWVRVDQNEECNPIPLTEEWLVRFGFVNTQIGLFEMEVLNYGKINIHITRLRLLVELGTKGGYLFGNTQIQYVHQLQNLYFSLTVTELTIK